MHRLLAPLLLLLVFPTSGRSEDFVSYRVDQWNISEGLPSAQIRDVKQAPDGYLWLATNGGAVRFDGSSFRVFDQSNTPGLPSSKIQTLSFASDGGLWLGGENFLVSLRSGTAQPFAEPPGLVHAVAEDRQGRPWILRDNGRLSALEEAGWRTFDERIEGLVGLSEEAVWVRLEDGRFAEVVGGELSARPGRQNPHAVPFWVVRRHLAKDAKGALLVSELAEQDLLVEASGDGGRFRVAGRGAIPWLVDRQGQLWITRDNVIEAWGPANVDGRSELRYRHELRDVRLVSAVIEDREGNLWVGTRSAGVFRLRPNLFRQYPAEDVRHLRHFIDLDSGELLVHSLGGMHRVAEDRLVALPSPVQGSPVLATRRARNGTLWSAGSGWLIAEHQDGSRDRLQVGDVEIMDLVEDPRHDGVLWARSESSLFILLPTDDGSHELVTAFEDRVRRPRFFFVDEQRRLWIGSLDGLHRVEWPDSSTAVQRNDAAALQDLRLVTLTGDGPLGAVQVRSVHEAEDGAFWFGTFGKGVLRYHRGSVARVDSSRGLAEDYVYGLVEDHLGWFWMLGNQGVHRASRHELEEVISGGRSTVNAVHYGAEAGLSNPEEGGNLGYLAVDGRLYFPNLGGIASVDPARVKELTQVPPRVHVEKLVIEGVDGTVEEKLIGPGVQRLELAPDQRAFTIEYTGISLRDASQVLFEYQLEGVDAGWVRGGTDRSVRYTRVDPGAHRFLVRAISAGSVPSQEVAEIELYLRPRFRETPFFLALLVASLIALGASLVLIRERSRRRRARELLALVDERTRELAVERDRAEEALQEVEAARTQLEEQAAQLRQLDEAKSAFFASVSHEFRTPLTLILGPLQDLLEESRAELAEATRGDLQVVAGNAQRLLRLVNQLLDTASLEAGRLELRARLVNVGPFLTRIAEGFEPLAERLEMRFEVELPPQATELWLDPEQFEKVVVNLLSNAFKFTPARGSVTLSVRHSGDERVELQVSDSGPGIDAEDLPHIFDRFYRAESSGERRPLGTGIGLAVAKELVELHGGELTASSSGSGDGAIFTVSLLRGHEHLDSEWIEGRAEPLDERLAEMERAEHLQRLVEEKMRQASEIVTSPAEDAAVPGDTDSRIDQTADETTILVVDDNSDLREYLAGRLRRRFRVLVASEGRSALELVRTELPDLVVSDVMMPEMSGTELCREIKNNPELDFVPVILLTARASEESKISGLEVGADDYVTKPFSARELEARIDNLIETRRRLRERFQQRARVESRSVALESGGAGDQAASPSAEPKSGSGFMETFEAAVRACLADEELTADTLASEIGMSRRALYRALREQGEEAPMAAVWRIRLESAAALLQAGEGNVSEVAYAVGFRSVSHFSRRFREQFGCPPSRWGEQA